MICISIFLCIKRFASARFSPGLEEIFIAGGAMTRLCIHFQARDQGLIQELWIRLEEGETSFVDVAEEYGEGPEVAARV